MFEEHEPRIIGLHADVGDEGRRLTLTQVHPDADSRDEHLRVIGDHVHEAFEVVGNDGVQVYGRPGPLATGALGGLGRAGVPVRVDPVPLAGSARFAAAASRRRGGGLTGPRRIGEIFAIAPLPPRRRPPGPLPAAVAIGALLAAAAPAAAIPFGADLNRPANGTVDCTVIPIGIFGAPSNAQTCTWTATGRLGDFTEGLNVPAGRGVITQVRVRVGPVTGPMQAVVFRSLRNPLSTLPPVCCQVQARSDVFTPAPNAVTTIQVNFPVVNDRVPEPGLEAVRFDTLALSVLAPGVPVPAHNTGNFDPATSQGALAFFPALGPPGEERVGPAGIGGFQLLVNGEWIPTPEGVTPTPTPASPAVVRLVQPVASVSGPTVTFGLRCTQATPCAGLVRLQSAPAGQGGAQVAAAAVRTYASTRFTIPAGATGRVRPRLSAAGRRLVRRTPRARVWANITMGGRVVSSTRISLR